MRCREDESRTGGVGAAEQQAIQAAGYEVLHEVVKDDRGVLNSILAGTTPMPLLFISVQLFPDHLS